MKKEKILIGARGSKLALIYAQNTKNEIIKNSNLSDKDIHVLYKNKVESHNTMVMGSSTPDSGFDLFIPNDQTFNNYYHSHSQV